MFAGQEANANTMSFIIILLACHPSIQRRLQHDIDRIVGLSSLSSPQSWLYEAVYPLLSDSMVGAVINESLRLFTALPFIPKSIPIGTPQAFNVADRIHILPPGTLVLINTGALHRNPKYCPRQDATLSPETIQTSSTLLTQIRGSAVTPVILSLNKENVGYGGLKKALSCPSRTAVGAVSARNSLL